MKQNNISNHKKLLKILSDGNFHTGSEIGEILGVTRAAIWKLIQSLKEQGLEVQAQTKLGYRILGGIELLNARTIKKFLPSDYHLYLQKTKIFDEINSTNTYLLEQASQGLKGPQFCLAESQHSGRGRFNREWLSPFGKNIYLSLLWHFPGDLSTLSGLSLVIAIAIIQALNKYGIEDICLKWPNDVLWNNHKLAGTLIELRGESNTACDAVIGIGLNVELPKLLKRAIKQPIADLSEIIKKQPERNKLIALLIESLIDTLTLFQREGLLPFIKLWKTLDKNFNQEITLYAQEQCIVGINRGINEQGLLLLEDAQGKIRAFSSGEVSSKKDSPKR